MNRLWKIAAVVLLLALGLGLRLYDLTDQPLDFHPTRQLRGALIARAMYYQMLPDADPEARRIAVGIANTTGQYEPSIVEKIVAITYLLIGQEILWVSRIYTSLFWLIGGVALFDMARRMTSFGGGLVTLAYYLVLPFAVQASRSFQPDPGMVMWIILSVYALYRWGEKPAWKWAMLAGVLGGMAVLTKVVAGYIVGGAAVAVVLGTLGLRRFWRSPQVWSMAVLTLTPAAIYYLTRGGRATEYFSGWTLSLSHLLVEPSFYARWLNLVQDLMGLGVLLLALVGVTISRRRNRSLLLGLWTGYALYGFFLPYQMYTHNYYHLQLVPIVALSLAPVGQMIIEHVAKQPRVWQALTAAAAVGVLLFAAGLSITAMNQKNYRGEPAHWQEIAALLPTDGKIIGLTQDYGYPLAYYGWRRVQLWPIRGERNLSDLRGISKEFQDFFTKRIEGKSYFLITAFSQLEDQPDLKQYLEEVYPLAAQGNGYLIYDLLNPRK
jgi:4-amino-4-deoxy-L-arabinose transferase-like glycosyltransferase